MTKKMKKKSCKAGNVNKEQKFEKEAMAIARRGEVFGNSIITRMSLTATDLIGMGAAAVGLAKAYAALKNVSKCMDLNIESLFENELSFFEGEYADLLEV